MIWVWRGHKGQGVGDCPDQPLCLPISYQSVYTPQGLLTEIENCLNIAGRRQRVADDTAEAPRVTLGSFRWSAAINAIGPFIYKTLSNVNEQMFLN